MKPTRRWNRSFLRQSQAEEPLDFRLLGLVFDGGQNVRIRALVELEADQDGMFPVVAILRCFFAFDGYSLPSGRGTGRFPAPLPG